jgi:C-terminal processing protease CtpA/Prc
MADVHVEERGEWGFVDSAPDGLKSGPFKDQFMIAFRRSVPVFLIGSLVYSQGPQIPVNGSFTRTTEAGAHQGWIAPKGTRVEFQPLDPTTGRRSLIVSSASAGSEWGDPTLFQRLDATPLRGKRIRLQANLRVEPVEGQTMARGIMVLRVDRPEKRRGFFDQMIDRPVLGSKWTAAVIIGDVAKDARQIIFGASLVGGQGRLWVDDVRMEILGATPAEPPRALTEAGRTNLMAFAKAIGFIRFFHPSDEAAKADWDRLTAEGVKAVEGARNPVDLAKRLHAFFAPYAPTATFLTSGQKPKAIIRPSGAVTAVRWVHLGFGQTSSRPSPIYQSVREYTPLNALPAAWRRPDRPLSRDLGGGVRLQFNTTCCVDASRRTLPLVRSEPVNPPPLPAPTATDPDRVLDRSELLSAAIQAWTVLDHFYPYMEDMGVNWDAELPKALDALALAQDAKAALASLKRLNAALKDGHGYVTESGESPAPPALDLRLLEGRLLVRARGESAKEVPLGSEIVALDGEPIAERLARMREGISSATEGWVQARLAKEILLGGHGETVRLTYRTPAGASKTCVLPRVQDPSVSHLGFPSPVQELKPGIWYVDLDRIKDADAERILPDLAKARGVIFDLRGYSTVSPDFLRHFKDKALQSARWNIPIITEPDRTTWTWEDGGCWDLQPASPRITGNVVFLAGGGTISYAESCLGIVEACKLGEIVGDPTAGTNGDITSFKLPGGFEMSWTGMKVLKQDGTRHHGVGIHPTVPVHPTAKGLEEGRDEVLEKGLEVIEKLPNVSAKGSISSSRILTRFIPLPF